MDKYICKICATIYDPQKGEIEDGIGPGTPFNKLPDSWICPVCGCTKDKYEILPPDEDEKILSINKN